MNKTIKKAKTLLNEARRRGLIDIFDYVVFSKRVNSFYCFTIVEKLERLF